jgi:hypothetical protein
MVTLLMSVLLWALRSVMGSTSVGEDSLLAVSTVWGLDWVMATQSVTMAVGCRIQTASATVTRLVTMWCSSPVQSRSSHPMLVVTSWLLVARLAQPAAPRVVIDSAVGSR